MLVLVKQDELDIYPPHEIKIGSAKVDVLRCGDRYLLPGTTKQDVVYSWILSMLFRYLFPKTHV